MRTFLERLANVRFDGDSTAHRNVFWARVPPNNGLQDDAPQAVCALKPDVRPPGAMRSDGTALPKLLYYSGAVERDPEIDRWLAQQPVELAQIGRTWFAVLRWSGCNVTELMHDGYATVCFEEAPFGYVGIFKSHVNVGFFQGSTLSDPARLLEGSGKLMRHVKPQPNKPVNESALSALIEQAYNDIVAKAARSQ